MYFKFIVLPFEVGRVTVYRNKSIALVIPAHNEERFIVATLTTTPEFVDRIFLVDDASQDSTNLLASSVAGSDPRIKVVRHQKNSGVGASVTHGYKLAMAEGFDIVARMDGDNQMPPSVLAKLLDPIVEEKAEFAKGNRLSNSSHRKAMPRFRLIGNTLLTMLTKVASGYWNINDPQNGFAAISGSALQQLDLDDLRKDYSFENDLLIHLNMIGARVVDVPHPAIYLGQTSKIRYPRFILVTSWVLFTGWLRRLTTKHDGSK